MSKPVWKDITSYCQGDKLRVPNAWEYRTENLIIWVHHHLDFSEDDWLLSCRSIGVEKRRLHNKGISEAKVEALDFVRKRLQVMVKELGPIA